MESSVDSEGTFVLVIMEPPLKIIMKRITQILAGLFTDNLMQPSLRFWWIPMQRTLENALRFSWSLYLEPTTFRYRRKPSAIYSVHQSLSPPCLPHHSKPHSYRTAENKEAILISLIIIYLFTLVLKKKKNEQKWCRQLVFHHTLSWTTEQLCLHVFHVYNVLYI